MSKAWSAKAAAKRHSHAQIVIRMGEHKAGDSARCTEKHLARAFLAGIERTMLMLDERGLLASDHAQDFLAAERARLLKPGKEPRRG